PGPRSSWGAAAAEPGGPGAGRRAAVRLTRRGPGPRQHRQRTCPLSTPGRRRPGSRQPSLNRRARLPGGAARPTRPGTSERLQGGLFFLDDLEELVQLGDLEDFVDLRGDVAQDQPPAGRLQLLVECDELAEGGARQVLHVAEI